jgi:hypothetical protein
MKSYNKIILASLFVISEFAFAQVGIGTLIPDDSAILELSSTSKGFLLPRLSSIQLGGMSNPPVGLMVYNTTTGRIETNKGSGLGALWISMSVSDTNPIDFPTLNQNTTGNSANVTGIVLPANGGTGIANNTASTLSLSGNFPIAITTTAATNIEFPTDGKLFGTKLGSITSLEVANAINDETGSGNIVFSTSPNLTGIPVAPTAAVNTNTTQLATTAFVLANSGNNYFSVDGTAAIDTRATADEVVPGMTLTSVLGGTYAVSFNAQYEIDPSDRTTQAAADMLTGYNALMALPNTLTIANAIPTSTFTPGVYNIIGAATVAANVIITLNGSGTYIFKSSAALSFGATVTFVLQNGATASEVFWIAEGAVSVGADCRIIGSLISNSGAVSVGATTHVTGKLLAINVGAITLSTDNITNTGSSAAVNWGLITSFVIFSKGGVLSNAGASIIIGDIGTKTGFITTASFDAATVTGSFYTALIGNALASFSVYQNGTLIASSKRIRSSTLPTVDITLQTMATVGAGQNIDIRWSIDSGKITFKNRNFTILNVR